MRSCNNIPQPHPFLGLLEIVNPTLQCLVISTVFVTMSFLHPTSRNLTNYLASLLAQNGHNFAETADGREIVCGIKEHVLRLSACHKSWETGRFIDSLSIITPKTCSTTQLYHNIIYHLYYISYTTLLQYYYSGWWVLLDLSRDCKLKEITALAPRGTSVSVKSHSDRQHYSWLN